MSRISEVVAGLIEHYRLTALPVEGTLWTQTHVGAASSAIIGLYAHHPPSMSKFHRLSHDEVWHHYAGDALRLVLLHPDGSTAEVRLGSDLAAGEHVQYLIPAGTWQAGHVVDEGEYALFGCTVAPAFTADCFEGGRRRELLARYPARAADIERLALDDDEPTRMP